MTDFEIYFVQKEGGKVCEDKCEKDYNKCLEKGLDLGTLIPAPEGVVKRICADEYGICHLECHMEFH